MVQLQETVCRSSTGFHSRLKSMLRNSCWLESPNLNQDQHCIPKTIHLSCMDVFKRNLKERKGQNFKHLPRVMYKSITHRKTRHNVTSLTSD